MIKNREITAMSLVTNTISIYRMQKRRLKPRYDTIPIMSISAIYHDIFDMTHL